MKIVHVIPALTKGGAERVVVDLANAAVEEGHEVSIVAAVPAPPQLVAHALRPEVCLVAICVRLRVRGCQFSLAWSALANTIPPFWKSLGAQTPMR